MGSSNRTLLLPICNNVIILTAIDPQGRTREFFYQPHRIELGFDVVSQLAAQGTTLIDVQLVDQGIYMPLPIEAFDGTPLAAPIEELERDWTRLLEQPPQTIKRPTNQEFLNWAHQQVFRCEQNIRGIDQLIDVFTKLIQEREHFFSFREPRLRQTEHFRFMLNRYKLKRIKASTAYELAVKRINTLMHE